MSGSVSGGQSACCCSSPLAAPRALDNSQAPLAKRTHRDVRITGRSIWIERLQLFLPTTSSTTEQVLVYLKRHHWFFGVLVIGHIFHLHDKSVHARFDALDRRLDGIRNRFACYN